MMKFVCGLTLLGALEVQGQHHEPTCDFAALMEKVRGVAEQGMPIGDLQADPVFQACQHVARMIGEVQIASSCPGGGGGAYPAGSCGAHAWGADQDGEQKCWSPLTPFPAGDPHLHDTIGDTAELCCNAEDFCDFSWASEDDQSRMCKFWEGICPADHYKRGSHFQDCDGHMFDADGRGPEQECCIPTCATWGGVCDEANGWWYNGDDQMCWGPECTEDHCCATSCSANFDLAGCDAIPGLHFDGTRHCHGSRCQADSCCVNSCHTGEHFECPTGTDKISDMDVPNFPVAEFAPESERQEACCVTRCNSLPDETCTGEQRLTQEWDAICTDPADCAASCCERPCSDLQFTCPIGATPIPSEWEPEAVPSNADQRCCMYTCDANTQCPDAGTVADPYRDCNWDGHNPDECHDPGHCCAPFYEIGSIAADWFSGADADRASTFELQAFSDPACTVLADQDTERGGFESGVVTGTSGECGTAVWMSTETKEHCEHDSSGSATCTTETEVETRVIAATAFCGGPGGARAFEFNYGGRANTGGSCDTAVGDRIVDAGGGVYFEPGATCVRAPGDDDDDDQPYFQLTCTSP